MTVHEFVNLGNDSPSPIQDVKADIVLFVLSLLYIFFNFLVPSCEFLEHSLELHFILYIVFCIAVLVVA